jgi:hypothetical protein
MDDLSQLKDDMVAFITGHGFPRFRGNVTDDLPIVQWEDEQNPDSWKDFVELAKAAGASFITMSDATLEKEDLQLLLDQIKDQNFPDSDTTDIEDAEYLERYVGKMGYIQLGFAHQGVMFMHESSTEWFDRYQQLLDSAEAFGNIVIEDTEDDRGT